MTTPAATPHDVAHRDAVRAFGVANYKKLRGSRGRNSYFHRYLGRIVAHNVLPNARVLDIGCGNGDMLARCKPSRGVGIDINPEAIADAKVRHPNLTFHEMAAEELGKLAELSESEPFDYVILSGTLPQLYDLHTVLELIRGVCHDRTRILICTFSRLWQPAIRLAEMIGWKARVPDECWIPGQEVENLLGQCDFEVVKQTDGILIPVWLPAISNIANRILAPLAGIRHLCLSTVTVGRMLPRTNRAAPPASVSVIIPARE